MLRLLIGTGVLLMAVGFGAAGWQYWQGLPADTTAAEDADAEARASEAQLWLISPTGGIVPVEDSRAFLVQDRLVPDRMAKLTVTARLDSLLVEGEKLPSAPYLEVLADIRAPGVGQVLCPILTATLARTCAVHSARVVPGSVDSLRGEARFEVELAYRQNVEGEALPDLAAHVLRTETLRPDPAVLPLPASAEAALTELVAATLAGCEIEDRAATCRSLGLTLDWAPGAARQAEARIGWLAPLPEGMTTLPPIEPLPEG
jgi:hypothetical protein